MNICILKESLTIGGTERSAANISKVLCGEHDVLIALYDASKTKYSYAGEIIDFRLPPKASFVGKVCNTFFRDIKLRRLIKDKQVDILYTFTGIGNRQTRYRYNTVKIISARDFGAMRERYRAYNAALKNSDAMICNSEYTRNYYLSKYPEHADRVFALYNYIDIAEIRKQSEEMVEPQYLDFLQKHTNTLVSVGRFCKEKGFEYLIEAFAQVRRSNSMLGLVLVGDGEYKQKYLDIIRNLGVEDHVFFCGFQQNPYKYMARCTCFVLSSLSEGFPNVLAEAMALGLPAIAANCYSGPAEILRKDKDYEVITDRYQECDFGIITPRMTEENNACAIAQLGEAINGLLGEPNKIHHYTEMSKIRAEDFSMESTREQLNLIFNELVDRRRKND